MTDTPGIWRGYGGVSYDGLPMVFPASIRCGMLENCTVVPDTVPMPLDYTTQRLVDLLILAETKGYLKGKVTSDGAFEEDVYQAIANFDKARGGKS